MKCAFCNRKKHIENQRLHMDAVTCFQMMSLITGTKLVDAKNTVKTWKQHVSSNCSVNPLTIFLCRVNENFMILVEYSFHALLLRVPVLFPRLHGPNGKIAPPPVDLPILLLRQLDQCHGNLDWLDDVRR